MVTFQRMEADNGDTLYRLYEYNNNGRDIEFGIFQEEEFLDLCQAVVDQYAKLETARTASIK